MRTRYLIVFCIVLLVFSGNIYSNLDQNKEDKIDYVPDAETAIKVAEAIWLPIFGKRIYDEKPFVATLENGVWIVEGTFKHDSVVKTPRSISISVGGVAYIEIQKSDCRVLKVSHGK